MDVTKNKMISQKRIKLLNEEFSRLFETAHELCKYSGYFATTFSSILLRTLFSYLTSDNFVSTYKIDEDLVNYLGQKKEQSLKALVGLTGLGADSPNAFHSIIYEKFSSIFLIECLTGYVTQDILGFIYPQDKLGTIMYNIPSLSSKERCEEIGNWILLNYNRLKKIHPGGRYPGSVFAGTLIRTALRQIAESNYNPIEAEILAFIERKVAELGMMVTSIKNISKPAWSVQEFTLLDHHAPIFLCSTLFNEHIGSYLVKLLTLSDEEIGNLETGFADDVE